MLEGIVAAHPAHLAQVPGAPRAVVARQRAAGGQGRARHRRRVRARADLRRVRGPGARGRGGGRQRLRVAAAGPDPRMHPGGERRGGRALHVRQLCRRRDELRHGRRDGGDGGDRGAHGPDDRRRRLRAARAAGEPARAWRATSSSSRRRGRPATGGCRSTRSSGWRARRTTGPSPWGWRWRPARCRRRGGRTSRSATTRWRSAWASTASPGWRAGRWQPADAIVDAMMDRILDEMAAARGEKVAVLVNGLGVDAADGALHHEPAGEAAARRGGDRGACDLGRELVHLARDGGGVGDLHAPRRGADRRCSTIPATARCSGWRDGVRRGGAARDGGGDRRGHGGEPGRALPARRGDRRRRPRDRHGAWASGRRGTRSWRWSRCRSRRR